MKTDEEYFAKFEQMTEPEVVAKIARGFAGKQLALALSWMAVKNHERLLRVEALDTENRDLAESANTLASDANLIADKALTRATIAAIAAIAAAVAAVIAAVVTVTSFSSN